MYLDPGSGSLILQAVLAAVFGAGVLIKIFWRKIKGIFRKQGDGEHPEVNDSQE